MLNLLDLGILCVLALLLILLNLRNDAPQDLNLLILLAYFISELVILGVQSLLSPRGGL